jgi:type 1 glutamine amidotransferase
MKKSIKTSCLISLIFIACSFTSNAASEEVRPGVFRTPDERFENLKDYFFTPHYIEVDSQLGKLRMHYVDVGHSARTFDEPLFRKLLLRGMACAAGENPLLLSELSCKIKK